MRKTEKPIRVLYSFPHKLGADRICYTAWQQVNGLAKAGVEVHVRTGALQREVPPGVSVQSTLARGKFRVPYTLLGSMRAFALHDWLVARELESLNGNIDIVHTWPLGAVKTLRKAAELGIPTVLERPNAHTRYAYESVQRECQRIGVSLPPRHEHAYKQDVLDKEEEEYRSAYRLLCPSEFTLKTFSDEGYPREQLVRHIYGFDEQLYYPDPNKTQASRNGLTMLFVGVCAVRKGVHFALEAWLKSPASQDGTLLIAGEFLPAYRDKLAPLLAHPSIKVLGHRRDVPDLMRKADVLVLPSIEEGFGLVCTDAIGSLCVPLVSEACTDLCKHMENALVHQIGDVDTLTQHISLVYKDRELLDKLRDGCKKSAPNCTWTAAGVRLAEAYKSVIEEMDAARK